MSDEVSETTLLKKLGFASGDSIYVDTTPAWYSGFADDKKLDLTPGLPATHAHIFCNNRAALAHFLATNDLHEIESSLWISWPKKTSGLQTNLTDDDIRGAVLPLGWVDVKVAAMDETWSGLKFIRRKHA